jgi:hypothetical protein
MEENFNKPEVLHRRSAIKLFAAGAVTANLCLPEWLNSQTAKKLWVPNSWNETTRPEHVWENNEDRMYHDLDFPVPEMQTAPEFFALMGQIWVFNTAMQWHREGLDGCILCHCSGSELLLTGEQQVSKWHSEPRNVLRHRADTTTFEKKSGRHRDCAVLPAFQFHLGQTPTVEVAVSEASTAWEFCASIKGRSGPPFLSTGWKTGPAELSLNISSELKRLGYNLNFAEVHFVMGLWTDDSNLNGSVSYRVRLPSRPTVIGTLPVIRTSKTAAAEGLPIIAAVLSESGERLDSERVGVHAVVSSRKIPLHESGGFWKATIRDLAPGDYVAELVAEGSVQATTQVHLRITDGQFLSYDQNRRSMMRGEKVLGPLSGSYQGTFYFKNVGLPQESLVNDQTAWDEWDRSIAPGEHLHYWESLNEQELEHRFSYLQQCGWDLLHLHQHWGVWERLDAGGRISPHGVEQVALYMRVAGRHGLALLQSLSSYEYAAHRKPPMIGGTPPWSVYVDAGFQDPQWYRPEGTVFQKMFHQYLLDFVSIFKEETALAGMLASGEGDHENGPTFTNDVFHYVKSLDPNHFFPSEPLFGPPRLPSAQSVGFEEELFGDRTYFIADQFLPEYDLGVMFKHLQTGRNYLAEGSWPTPNIYTALHYYLLNNDHKDPGPDSWVGTLRYRTRLRDTYYLGLVHRVPILDTWDEYFAEDEHVIFRKIREQVNWKQPFDEPLIVIRIDQDSYGRTRDRLVAYETLLAKIPLASRYILPEAPTPDNAAIVLDTRLPLQNLSFQSQGGALPDDLKGQMPIDLDGSTDYCCNYLLVSDRSTLLAYLYNTSNHLEEKLWICGRYHRVPKPTTLDAKLQNLSANQLKYYVFDLNVKRVIKEGILNGSLRLTLGKTDHDYFVLVTPS